MYTLIKAVARSHSSGGRWMEVDIGDMPINTIFNTYTRVIAVLSNQYLQNQVSLDLEKVRAPLTSAQFTFNEFLSTNGDKQLPTSDTLPNLSYRYARYNDAFKAGYKIVAINELTSMDAELPEGAKDWLFLTRPVTDYKRFGEACLISVNGYYHRIDTNAQGIWVVNGMVTARVTNDNHIGITYFGELGKLKVTPITKDMLFRQSDDTPMGLRACLKVPNLDGVTTMLVIGGYLHTVSDPNIYRTGDNTLCIDFENIPLIERIYESMGKIDLSSLKLDTSDTNPSVMSPGQLFSDEVISAYMTLTQSFIVQIDNTELFVDHVPLPTTTLPGMYISHTKPDFPIVCGFGRLVNFWAVHEDGRWAVNATDTLRPNFLFKTALDYSNQQNVSDSKITQQRWEHDRLFNLMLGTNV